MIQLGSDSLIVGLNVNQSGLSFIQNTCSNSQYSRWLLSLWVISEEDEGEEEAASAYAVVCIV